MTGKIGDETFIIAALMAMRHPRATVLSGALTALIIMTVSYSVLSFGLNINNFVMRLIFGSNTASIFALQFNGMFPATMKHYVHFFLYLI